MRKPQLFLTFLMLFLGSLLLGQLDRFTRFGFGPIEVISEGFSITPDWLGRQDRLEHLDSLSQVLQRIRASYVDPKRVDPSVMFTKALESISQTVPEVRVLRPDPKKAALIVNESRLEFDTDIPTLYGLQTSISDALKFVRSHRKSDISDKDLEIASISGVLSTLDPHSVYLSEDLYTEMKVGTTGTFGGLGIVIGLRDTKLTIIAPLEGTPAHKVGLRAGDWIKKIGDESTLNMSLTEAVEKMRGPKGTVVTISVMRDGWTTSKDFSITRDIIKIVSVESQLLPENIGYVKVKNFQGNTSRDLNTHLARMTKEAGGALKGLILDLRNDPGGLLDQAVAVSDKFLSDGPIVTTVGFSNTVREEEKATSIGTEPNYPMAVLVNEGSASASEIVAGALQRRDRAVILGQRTFGKGTVQSIFDLPENAAVKLTIAQYLTPGDFSIQTIGIVPDIKILPSVISPDRMDVFRNRKRFGEVSLDRHFDRPGEPAAAAEALEEIHYLEKRADKQIAEEDAIPPPTVGASMAERQKAALKDFEIFAAHSLLKASENKKSRKEILSAAGSLATSLNKDETAKIVDTLSSKGIDWSAPKNGSSGCGVPKATATATNSNKSPVKAGDTLRFAVTLENPGPCTLYQSWTLSDSKNYLFDDREFLFGKVPPGGKVTRDIKVEVPKSTPANLADVSFTFHEAKGNIPVKTSFSLPIRALEGPRFAFSYEINDASGADTKGNGNGKLEAGESVELKIRVKNVGKSATSEASAILRETGSKSLKFRRGRMPISTLAPGEERKFSFLFDVQSIKADTPPAVDLMFVDPIFRVYTTKKLLLPSEGKVAATKSVNLLTPPQIDVDTEKLAFLKSPGQFLKLNGKIKDVSAVKDVFVFVNNRKVFYQNFSSSEAEATLDSSIPLESGVNRVLIVARDSEDLRDQKAFLIARPGEVASDAASVATNVDEASEALDLFLMDPSAP